MTEPLERLRIFDALAWRCGFQIGIVVGAIGGVALAMAGISLYLFYRYLTYSM